MSATENIYTVRSVMGQRLAYEVRIQQGPPKDLLNFHTGNPPLRETEKKTVDPVQTELGV